LVQLWIYPLFRILVLSKIQHKKSQIPNKKWSLGFLFIIKREKDFEALSLECLNISKTMPVLNLQLNLLHLRYPHLVELNHL